MADRAVAILREACRAAEELGMKIAIENHADFTVREHASISARVNSPALGYTVDCATWLSISTIRCGWPASSRPTP